MADRSRAIIDRARSYGANVIVDGGKLEIVNPRKLPAGAIDVIKANSRDLVSYLECEAEFDERAAIIEYDGGLNRPIAEYLTRLLMTSVPEGIAASDWSWFVGQASQIVDRSLPGRAA